MFTATVTVVAVVDEAAMVGGLEGQLAGLETGLATQTRPVPGEAWAFRVVETANREARISRGISSISLFFLKSYAPIFSERAKRYQSI